MLKMDFSKYKQQQKQTSLCHKPTPKKLRQEQAC